MEAVITYNLDDPQDAQAHLRSLKSLDMACSLFEIIHNTKRKVQNDLENNPPLDFNEAVDVSFSYVLKEISSRGINIDEIIS